MKEGFRSGKLVTMKKVQNYKRNPPQSEKWLCICDCGNEKITLSTSLHVNSVKSCGCHDYKNKKMHDKENYEDLIKEKINKNIFIDQNMCWIWLGSKNTKKYGNINYKRKSSLVHRVSWMIYKGKIPEGIKVCHKCDVTSCCNPEHLFLGTQKDNVNDAKIKGRWEPGNLPRRNKLNFEQVQEIKKLSEQGMTRKELQSKYEVGQTCIAKILTGRSWNVNWTKEL